MKKLHDYFKYSQFLALGCITTLQIPHVLAQESSVSIGLESRTTYTRWYEYPSTYFEETFSILGIRGERYYMNLDMSRGQLDLGIVGGLYPLGSYNNGWNEEASAYGLRPGLISQYSLTLNPKISFLAQMEVAYLLFYGSGDVRFHDEGFGVYFPSIDGGLGLAINKLSLGSITSIKLLYTFGFINLGVSTDNFVQGSPIIENWSNSSVTLMFDF